jgi:hypothetical protein
LQALSTAGAHAAVAAAELGAELPDSVTVVPLASVNVVDVVPE